VANFINCEIDIECVVVAQKRGLLVGRKPPQKTEVANFDMASDACWAKAAQISELCAKFIRQLNYFVQTHPYPCH
jgi:hypothetical protein